MTDRVPGAPGQYKAVITEAELQKMQTGEQFTITMTRDDHPITEGTPYSKAAVLPDALASQLCPEVEDPTPADALKALHAKAIESEEYPGCYYRMVDGEQEWLNPPMTGGLEYRTTERSGGDPLYTKSIYCGVLIDQMQVDLPSSIIYRWHGWTSIGTVMGSYQANEAWSLTVQFLPNTKKVMFRLGSDAVAAGMVGYVQVWFKKK